MCGGALRRRAAGAALLAAACAGLGCPEAPRARPAPPDAQPAPSRGVKVPLEDGWSARLGPEQSLTIGPPGRAVLRIDLRPGAARQRPGAEDLIRLFRLSFTEGQIFEEGRREEEGFAMVRLELSSGDGGGGRTSARLGAKAVGDDLFLCASVPGATGVELEAVERACEGISYSVGP